MITVENFKAMHGTGGMDMEGEWQWSGDYYKYLTKGYETQHHHYHIRFSRRGTIDKTKGWHVSVYVCLSALNSSEVCILREKTKTLKAGKEAVVKRINEFEESDEFQTLVIENYLPTQAKPVFGEKNGEIVFLGTTYGSEAGDMRVVMERKEDTWLYYNHDIPAYREYDIFYSVEKAFWNKEDGFSISRTKKHSSGYSGGGVREKELREKLIDLTKKMPKFQHLFVKKESQVM